MHVLSFARPLVAITLLSCSASFLHAQGIGQRQDEIIVTAAAAGSPTSPSVEEARAELERIPGAIGVVEDEGFADIFAQSIGDTLELTPGVFADTSAQRESRISIRGSGLNSSFERRGLMVLRDGVPISRAAGNTEFQEIDPLTIRYIEVFKGANGLRYGATQLGGAVNVVSPTGRTARAGLAESRGRELRDVSRQRLVCRTRREHRLLARRHRPHQRRLPRAQ